MRAGWKLLPNALTLLRMLLAAAFPLIPPSFHSGVLVAALLTEVGDGALARALGAESRTGRILDPIADRLLFASVALTLWAQGELDGRSLAMLGTRDALIVGGTLALLGQDRGRALRSLRPRAAGKTTTGLQYVALLWLVLTEAPLPGILPMIALGTGVVAAFQYGGDYRRAVRAAGGQSRPG